MSMRSEVSSALGQYFGPTTNFKSGALTAATESLIYIGPALLHSLSVIASAAGAVTFGFVDATGTATGTVATWAIYGLPQGGIYESFVTPLRFDKGLVMSYTASGAFTLSVNAQWSPNIGHP